MDRDSPTSSEHYDLLRVVAALLVLIGHQNALTGLPEPEFLGISTWGGLGVAIFFSLSGYLVSASWQRDPHLGRYLVRRALRLMPGLAGVVLLSTLILGPLMSSLTLVEYFSHPETWHYLRNLALNVRFALPGVFVDLPFARVTNGSLWTLPMEVGCYLGLALLLLPLPSRLGGRFLWLVAATLWLLDVAVPTNAAWIVYSTNWRIALHFAVSFALGAALRLSPPRGFAPVPWAVAAMVVLIFTSDSHLGRVLSTVCVPLAVIGIARISGAPSRWLARRGDLSYGLYLYAFPLQQGIVASGLHERSRWGALAIAIAATGVAATISWRFIESPALRWKPRSPSRD